MEQCNAYYCNCSTAVPEGRAEWYSLAIMQWPSSLYAQKPRLDNKCNKFNIHLWSDIISAIQWWWRPACLSLKLPLTYNIKSSLSWLNGSSCKHCWRPSLDFSDDLVSQLMTSSMRYSGTAGFDWKRLTRVNRSRRTEVPKYRPKKYKTNCNTGTSSVSTTVQFDTYSFVDQ